MTFAGQWYASSAFADTLAVVLVTVVATLVGAWAVRAVGFPKRRLICSMPVVAPLLSAPAGMRGDLELRRNGKPLSDPHVIEVRLTSRSRRDIPSDDFDNRQPLLLDVGATIIEILRTTSAPASPPAPEVTHDNTALKVGPSLIGKRQKITMTILVDGPNPHLSYTARLINVDVREQKPEDPEFTALNFQLMRQQGIALVGIFAGLAASAVAAASKHPLSPIASWIAAFLLTTGCLAQFWMITTTVTWSQARRQRRKITQNP